METTRPRLVDIPLPQGDHGIKKIWRHSLQVLKLFTSSQYRSYKNLQCCVRSSYSTNSEKKFWSEVAEFGLEDYEKRALADALNDSPHLAQKKYLNVLMVGCGAGREAFGLEQLGYQVTATDISPILLQQALNFATQRQSQVRFLTHEEFQNHQEEYDLVFVTNALLNLIPGKKLRTDFLKKISGYLHHGSRVLLFADVEELSPKGRLYWISLLLKAKSLVGLGEWEKGDVVSSSLGNWAGDYDPILFHYFPNEQSFLNELKAANLIAQHQWGIFWLAQKL